MTDHNSTLVQPSSDNLSELLSQLESESEKKQLQLITQLASDGEAGWGVLREFLRSRQSLPANLVAGKAYQVLYQSSTPANQEFLAATFPQGVVPLKSEKNLDYLPLQRLLTQQDFQAADNLTRQKLCELAGVAALQRKWVYFTEVEQFPAVDLATIDRLWVIHSEGKFGFSVQRQLWLSLGKDFVKLWPAIGWKKGNNWTQYPNQFIWDLSAPKGHLPLSNQLRGVRLIASVFAHPVWSAER